MVVAGLVGLDAHALSPCVTVRSRAVHGLLLVDARGVRGDPDREGDQAADADDPGEEALGDRAERAEAEAAVRRLGVGGCEVGDDVALLVGRQVAVGEGRHLLRAGEQGLVDVAGLDAAQGRARSRRGAWRRPGRRSCGRRCSWSGRSGRRGRSRPRGRRPSRRARSRAACSRPRSGRPDRCRGSRRRRRAGGSPPRCRWRLALGLLAGLGQRHPAGADLEVDRGGADVGEGGAVLVAVDGQHALAVLAVAEGAADDEQLLARLDVVGGGAGLVGAGARGEGGVQAAGEQQADQEDHGTRERALDGAGRADRRSGSGSALSHPLLAEVGRVEPGPAVVTG